MAKGEVKLANEPINHGEIIKKKSEGKLTRREMREQELILVLRKLKPQVGQAIETAVRIMGDGAAKHSDQLKAATVILENYKEIMNQAYSKEHDEDEADAIPVDDVPIFSLKVIGKEDVVDV